MTARDGWKGVGRVLLILTAIATGWGLVTAARSVIVATLVLRSDYDLQQQRLENKVDRILDLVCAGRETTRQCK